MRFVATQISDADQLARFAMLAFAALLLLCSALAHAADLEASGSGQPFDVHQPGLVVTFGIVVAGDFDKLGTIFMTAGSFVGPNAMPCEGQLLSITQFSALFSQLGTRFGGYGVAPLSTMAY